jgi:2-polyprenyl-6-methoxyphenol hydroxylase-like FAD-dependent oxidoreductase
VADRVLSIVKDCDEILKRAIDDSPIIIENKLQVRNFDLPWGSAYDGLIFIGDSAHPVRPTGEGTALAFEDARVLGEMIAEHGLSVKVLRAYEDERYEPVKIISEKVRASAQGFYKNSKKTV